MKITEKNYKDMIIRVILNPSCSEETRAQKFVEVIESLITSIKQEERERMEKFLDVSRNIDPDHARWIHEEFEKYIQSLTEEDGKEVEK